ncbi:MAG: CoA pyrophosphatase [Chloroflexales bacterium]|nr:CoA pyrophosphatase [Chloroflexales bacterium]
MTNWQHQIEHIRRALADPTPVPFNELLLVRDHKGRLGRQMEPGPGIIPREAAALLLLYLQDDELWLPLTVRSAALPLHRGEVSLPGGGIDPEDDGPIGAALREAYEELGIAPEGVEILGILTPFYIPPSNFRLAPVVGFAANPPVLRPNPTEVEAAFSVSLQRLMDPATVEVEQWTLRGMNLNVPFFALNGHKVWGATALLLSELLARLRRTMDESAAQ